MVCSFLLIVWLLLCIGILKGGSKDFILEYSETLKSLLGFEPRYVDLIRVAKTAFEIEIYRN